MKCEIVVLQEDFILFVAPFDFTANLVEDFSVCEVRKIEGKMKPFGLIFFIFLPSPCTFNTSILPVVPIAS